MRFVSLVIEAQLSREYIAWVDCDVVGSSRRVDAVLLVGQAVVEDHLGWGASGEWDFAPVHVRPNLVKLVDGFQADHALI